MKIRKILSRKHEDPIINELLTEEMQKEQNIKYYYKIFLIGIICLIVSWLL